MIPSKGDIIAVWFSCGAASAVAAKKTIEKYGNVCTVRVVNNNIQEEDSDNRRFLKDIEKWIGVTIESATNSKYPNCSIVEVFEQSKFMSSIHGAICTKKLKKEARQQFESKNKIDWHVLGFTFEEKRRYENFILTERPNTLPVLIDANLTKSDCFKILQEAGIELPRIYSLGYSNANCIGCVKATSPAYWNHVRKMHPGVFKERAEQSRRIGVKLVRVKGKRIYLDELLETDKGRPMKNESFECGIFCEEKIIDEQ
jgi:hypothetical protein